MNKNKLKYFIRLVNFPDRPGTFIQIYRKDDDKLYYPRYNILDQVSWWRKDNWSEYNEGECVPSGYYIPWDIEDDVLESLYIELKSYLGK